MGNQQQPRVLIANRGAIAVRIQRTLRAMGIDPVVVYHESDRESLHVQQARTRYSLGSGTVQETYLNIPRLIEVAKESGAWGVHPGYGFLSENADFVRACEDAELVFLGPSADQIESFGLKHQARHIAEKAGVPLVPGTAALSDLDAAFEAASKVGYPVMLKSSAGGGGIGMAVCKSDDQLARAWDSVLQVSRSNFSDATLFLERFVERARHIEVQVFGDGRGGAIALGERDCSAQRRNQKVIEETPAPNIDDELRGRLQNTALDLLKAVSYRSAGTVEFIVDADTNDFYFLEVNTRLQVEHGVTEAVWGVDLVRWMVELGQDSLAPLSQLRAELEPSGHAIQARLYAEDPWKDFQPSSGLLTEVMLPTDHDSALRVDTWIEAGVEVSGLFDPMLAKVIAKSMDRDGAVASLKSALESSSISGLETNISYLRSLLVSEPIDQGRCLTSTLASLEIASTGIDVVSGGTMTTIQDFPGRTGYWGVGVPPSGPFDSLSFRLGNRLLENEEVAAGLEVTLDGPELRFRQRCNFVMTGSPFEVLLDDVAVEFWKVQTAEPGQTLRVGAPTGRGIRCYLLIEGGFDCPQYLGSRSTFTLGAFGGHAGRALRAGDVLHQVATRGNDLSNRCVPISLRPADNSEWKLQVVYGPQGTTEYFTADYLQTFFDAEWRVHYNSSRTGVRLVGPKPEWARSDGGEAGMHPSNIHDNAYAIGTVDFTGDMPVILGPDGPSLGGFVCPATVISADLWKLGRLTAGDRVRFVPVSLSDAVVALENQSREIASLQPADYRPVTPAKQQAEVHGFSANGVDVSVRRSGDAWLLVEYGPPVLDVRLRFHAHRLMLSLQEDPLPGMLDLTPGIRSLQLHYAPLSVSASALTDGLIERIHRVAEQSAEPVPSRVLHLPLSWDDPACRKAIDKYQHSVRSDAPWYPSNIEFIRRINGLDSEEAVRNVVFDASYLVMGLGDVYLGAPVATPLDPRHRLVTTKYNPARTWTAENSVGIGGSYLCVYGMEGPGGYQLFGRTLQMWNRFRSVSYFPRRWLLKFFDQIRFFEVSHDELTAIRNDFLIGNYELRIEESEFDLGAYEQFLVQNIQSIEAFTQQREQAFQHELQEWKATGQLSFETVEAPPSSEEAVVPSHFRKVESPVSGNIWQVKVEPEQQVVEGECLLVLESMKMEIEIRAPVSGTVKHVVGDPGLTVLPGQSLVHLEPLE
ncbi:urea carboxylase [Luminiphilus sp.]|nr:urea carboxylase [Luminiphilus sp.]MDA9722034.1 urea carboxylase [Luminiphilus sp.]